VFFLVFRGFGVDREWDRELYYLVRKGSRILHMGQEYFNG
jgi:hypothetical protein